MTVVAIKGSFIAQFLTLCMPASCPGISDTITFIKSYPMDIDEYKQSIKPFLQPYFEMLLFQKKQMTPEEWIGMVNRMCTSMAEDPAQYFGNDLPPHQIRNAAIREIFTEFLKRNGRAYRAVVL